MKTRVGVAMAAGIAMAAGAGVVSAGQGPDDARAYAAELKADAALRSSLLAADEGESSVKLAGYLHFRYYLNFRDDPQAASFHDSGFTSGFEAPRTRLGASGNIVSKDLTFKIEGDFSKSTGAFSLLDAYTNYKLADGWSFRLGQFKPPLLREELIGDQYQLTVNRSVTNDIFTQKRSQGIQGAYQTDAWQARVYLGDGLNTLNTEFADPKEADFATTARVDFKGGGDWKTTEQFTAWRGGSKTWLVGAAAHYQHEGNTASTAAVTQQARFEYTADFTYYGDGWNLYAAGIGRHLDPDTGGTSLDDFGLVLQGGTFINDSTELFGRYDAVFADNSRTNHDTFSTVTAGVNWYLYAKSQAAKFSADVAWYPNATTTNDLASAVAASNSLGLRPSDQDNQIALRLQFQLIF